MQAVFKKFTNWFSILLFVTGTVSAQVADRDTGKRELKILNWSQYLDPELAKKFEDSYNVTLKEIYFESDDYRDNYMLETQGKGIDVIVVNGIQVRKYGQQDWITPLTTKQVPNLEHIDKKWLTMFEGIEGHAVPYFWGTLGIVYRKDLINQSVSSWKDLYQPAESLRGKIAMVGSSRDLIGMALKALGYSANSGSFSEMEQAKQLLLNQKPFVKDYTYINLDDNSSMAKGDIVMAMAYSGDAMMLQEVDENIAYVVPEEGGNFWVDYMVVSKNSRHKDLAYQFIDFINEPAHAAQMAEYVYYATPNKAAEKLLPDDFLSDEVIYPSKDILDKSQAYTRLPPRVTRFRNEVFSRVTE